MPQSIAVFRFLMVQIEIIFIQIYIPFPKVQILFVNDIPIIIYENSHFVIFLPLPYIGQSVFYNMIISVFIGYVADYSKFRILRPFQRVYRTKPGIFYLVPPGQYKNHYNGCYCQSFMPLQFYSHIFTFLPYW